VDAHADADTAVKSESVDTVQVNGKSKSKSAAPLSPTSLYDDINTHVKPEKQSLDNIQTNPKLESSRDSVKKEAEATATRSTSPNSRPSTSKSRDRRSHSRSHSRQPAPADMSYHNNQQQQASQLGPAHLTMPAMNPMQQMQFQNQNMTPQQYQQYMQQMQQMYMNNPQLLAHYQQQMLMWQQQMQMQMQMHAAQQQQRQADPYNADGYRTRQHQGTRNEGYGQDRGNSRSNAPASTSVSDGRDRRYRR